MQNHNRLIEIVACIIVASIHCPAGTSLTFSAILIPQLEDPDSDIRVTKEDISWIASIGALVIPVGAVVSGFLMDRIGRLNTIRVASVPYIIGWTSIAMAQGLTSLLVGRFITSFAAGLVVNPSMVYITEVARPAWRGALLCLAPAFVALAMVVVYSTGALLHWRTVAWLSVVYFVLPQLLMILCCPESPVWLISRGRSKEALASLEHFCGKTKKKAYLAEQQLAELTEEHNSKLDEQERQGSPMLTMARGFAKPTGYKPFLILTIIFAFQQFSGIYITIFYAVSFMKEMGSDVDSSLSSIGIAVMRLVFGIIVCFLLRNFGRRPLYFLSGTGMAVSMFISGYITREVTAGNMAPSSIPTVCILIYMMSSAIGLLTVTWTLTAELFPIEIRGMAQGLISAVAHTIMFVALKLFPFMADAMGGVYAVQWLFATMSLGSVLFIFVFLPETHSKPLSYIQEYFQHNSVYICRSETFKRTKTYSKTVDEASELNSTIR